MILDIHHHGELSSEAVTSFSVEDEIPEGEGYVSVGIHPWKIFNALDFVALESKLSDPRVVAIGEAGIDRMRGEKIELQKRIFEVQVQMSERHCLPLIIHAVKSADILIPLRKRMSPTMPWILHGFRGKPGLAQQLLNSGFFISIGEKFNPDTVRIIPDSQLLLETDTSEYNIHQIINTIAVVREQEPEYVAGVVAKNIYACLNVTDVKEQ